MRLGLVAGGLRIHTGTQPGFRLQRRSPLDVWGVLAKAKDWGFDGVMLSVDQLVSTDPGFLGEIRAKADELDLYLEAEVRFAQLRNLTPWLEAARLLSSSVLRIVVAPFGDGERWKLDRPAREYLDHMADQLAPCGERAAERGVRLAIENHMDFVLGEYLHLFDRLKADHFGVCLDTGNPLGTVEHPERVCRALAPLVITTHIKDYLPVWIPEGYRLLTCAIGEGVINNTEIVRILADHHRELSLNIELPVFSVRKIPIFRDGFWAAYGLRQAQDLGEVAELIVKAHGSAPADMRNGLEQGWPEERLLEAEETCMLKSLAEARRLFAPWLT
jgi:sugar phosphate isomerase/epimerase